MSLPLGLFLIQSAVHVKSCQKYLLIADFKFNLRELGEKRPLDSTLDLFIHAVNTRRCLLPRRTLIRPLINPPSLPHFLNPTPLPHILISLWHFSLPTQSFRVLDTTGDILISSNFCWEIAIIQILTFDYFPCFLAIRNNILRINLVQKICL